MVGFVFTPFSTLTIVLSDMAEEGCVGGIPPRPSAEAPPHRPNTWRAVYIKNSSNGISSPRFARLGMGGRAK